jgi:hypothetical protein
MQDARYKIAAKRKTNIVFAFREENQAEVRIQISVSESKGV